MLHLLLIFTSFHLPLIKGNAPPTEPEFVEPLYNLTVTAGRDIKLACAVKHLGSYKVAWIHLERSAILTVQNHVITRNPRISIAHDQHRTWTLHIANVQESDHGGYMCQINTAAAKSQVGFLSVVVPPSIDDALSSSDVTVREGSGVSLTCLATGSPPLSVRWKREDGKPININRTLSLNEWEGSSLSIPRVSRLDMGAYLCIASNGVPPTVSKRIPLSVEFPPMVWVPHQLVGAPLGSTVTLDCFLEAFPTALHFWDRGHNIVLHDTAKYRAEASLSTGDNGLAALPYKTHLRLTIANVTNRDYGTYRCVAKNPFGEADGVIKLYPTLSPSSTTYPQNNGDLPAALASPGLGGFIDDAALNKTQLKLTAPINSHATGKVRPGENSIGHEEFDDSGASRTTKNRSKSDWTFSWKTGSPHSGAVLLEISFPLALLVPVFTSMRA